MKDYSHLLAKLSPAGGPAPAGELRHLVDQCGRDPNSVAWFASALPGSGYWRAGNSVCVIFHHPDQSPRVEAVVARVLSKELVNAPPEDAEVQDFYGERRDQLRFWWPLGGKRPNAAGCDIVLTEFDSLDAIPGRQWRTGNTASKSFTARCSLAGWAFDEAFNTLDWIQSLPGIRP
ncbi:MAG: hypothetical protein P4L85_14405 [Paludisphaera borealis]|uniref:hypothetical protein n=1 Tax=Paludisphaera borealis TaxID=1387353 RepID=UPI00283CF0B7|nr:hypothetical protein [Paludisphaera borealis]MDR3620539.1 hypothetical protein [Paludisphaera borealis]